MKKIIFFDIDGTLVTEDNLQIIPQSTRNAISQARKNGHITVVNTGRTVFNISDEIRSLGFDGYICGCGTYIEFNGEELLYNKLDWEFCRMIADFMHACKAVPVFERRDCLFFDPLYSDNRAIVEFKNSFLDGSIPTDHLSTDDNFSFDKFVAFTDENTDIQKFREVVGKYFSIIDRGNGFYENVPIGFSKATAIDILLKKLGIPIENAYAIGDSMNDLPMLQAVPNSIAMGNSKQVYPYVSFVTKPIMEDGIEFALRHFEII